MSEDVVIRNCSPMLAGLKTGNLFPLHNTENLAEEIRHYNRILGPKGVRMIPITKKQGKPLIYAYRPKRLEKDLQDTQAKELLKKRGYCTENPNYCLAQLMRKFREGEFPHEIGLFLSYPPEDVKAFMCSTRKGVCCTGCWKAYSNKEAALNCFRKFRKCTDIYCKLHKRGKSIESMTVKER